MSYKMTDNDVCRVSHLDDTRLMVLNCQAHFEKAKQKYSVGSFCYHAEDVRKNEQ